jgi:hypothetical protein
MHQAISWLFPDRRRGARSDGADHPCPRWMPIRCRRQSVRRRLAGPRAIKDGSDSATTDRLAASPSLLCQAPGYTASKLLRREVCRYRESTFVFSLSALPPMGVPQSAVRPATLHYSEPGKGSSAHFSTRQGMNRGASGLRWRVGNFCCGASRSDYFEGICRAGRQVASSRTVIRP